jgi:hypothetical protein
MASHKPTTERHVDSDGVTRIESRRTGGGSWIVGLALGFTVLCLALSAWLVLSPGTATGEDGEPPRPPENTPPRASAPPPSTAPRPAQPTVRPEVQPVVQQTSATSPQPEPQQPPMTQDAEDTGPAEGIKLYRPGTKPLKQGIIVPDDFEVPQGYMRHYQTTDDGQMQKPILMFHPDYKPVDSNGQPVELPANRVVPPELAPPGMPIDILELPKGPEGVEPIP